VDELENVTQDQLTTITSSEDDLKILTEILAALRKLSPQSQERMLNTVATFLGINFPPSGGISAISPQQTVRTSAVGIPETSFSEDRSLSPKQFIVEKQPKTDVEKVACLAFYLTHYRDTPHFKTLDISKLNTEAAQVKFSNPTIALDNATKQNYLVQATKGTKQLSALGEQFVLALPDREKARAIMSKARPRRKSRKIIQQQPEDTQ
jgi:hypothetical protein